MKKIACQNCGAFAGSITEKWSVRKCSSCGLLVFKE